MDRLTIIQNPSIPLDQRCDELVLAGRDKDTRAFPEVVHIVQNPKQDSLLRSAAVLALCQYDKFSAFPVLVSLFDNPHLQYDVISHCPLLKDSRVLFPMIALYDRLAAMPRDQEDNAYLLQNAILRSLKLLGDDRATRMLKNNRWKSEQYSLVSEVNEACENHPLSYSYCGPESVLRAAQANGPKSIPIPSSSDILRARPFLSQENGIATYVVVDGTLYLAHRRSEHYIAAGGNDVLAAGEITFAGNTVTDIDNHSGGYVPGVSSFAAVSAALTKANITHPKTFTRIWPRDFDATFIAEYANPARYKNS